MEIPPALAAWLKRVELRIDVRAMRHHPDSRNPTLRCRDRRGARVFVKAAVRDDPGVAHERVVLGLLQGLSPVPRVVHSTKGMLALQWIEGRTLWNVRRARRQDPSAAIGEALARVQLGGRAAVAAFTVRGDLCERMLWTSPALYASLGPASLALFRQVQANPQVIASLTALLEGETAERALLVHGDLRQPNIMVHGKKITFVDWELCGLGDPARDLGSLLAEDVRAWLLPRDEAELQTRAQLKRHAGALLEGWERTVAALGHAAAEDHRARVIGWTGEALLRAAYTIAHHEAQLPQPIVDAAIAMLESPREWSEELLGASSALPERSRGPS